MPQHGLQGLYVITDATLCGDDVLTAVESAIRGGARIVQYRDKTSTARQCQEQALALRQLCHRHDVLFIINDDVELALQVDADGVHIGQQDTALTEARRRLGTARLIGVSCNNRLDFALQAQAAGADYIAFGRFFPSATKPHAPQAPLALLVQARRELSLPIVAIGGITADNAGQLLQAGADMLAVIHGVFGQEDIETAARRLSRCFA